MWKRLDSLIASSEKHTKFGFSPFVLWTMMLPHTDSKGRYLANPAFIKGQCLPMFEGVRLEQVDQAIRELERVGLIHLYDCGDKRYLVYHDVEDFNPPGNLRYQEAKWPDPEGVSCPCVHVVKAACERLSSSSSSSSASDGGGAGEDSPPPKRSPSKPGVSPEALLVAIWNDQPKRSPISPPKGVRFVETAVAAGVPIQTIEDAFWDQAQCAGKKIFDVLDDLTAKHGKSSKQVEFRQERDARGPRKL